MSSKPWPANSEHPRLMDANVTLAIREAEPAAELTRALSAIEGGASKIKTRLYQRIHIAAERDQHLFLVRRGTFLVRVSLPGDATLISTLLFPGDIFHTGASLPQAGASLIAGSDTGELWRLRTHAFEDTSHRSASDMYDVMAFVTDRMADAAARQSFHNVVISALTGEERVAALFLELVLRTGTETEAGIAFEMPLTRTDVADYLALNADTVSRIFSRLRAKTLIATAARNRLICPNVEALAKECPLASTLRALAKRPSF